MADGSPPAPMVDQIEALEKLVRDVAEGGDVREAVGFLLRAQIEALKPYASY